MKKVRCLDADSAHAFLVKGQIYKVKEEKGGYYILQGVVHVWAKIRFEDVKETPTQLDQLAAGTHQKWADAKNAQQDQAPTPESKFDFDAYNGIRR